MATAAMKARASTGADGGTVVAPGSVSMEFLIVEDNGGDYHWEIVGEGGETLAQSRSFASYDDAERAARRVYDHAGSARFEPHLTEERQLVAV